MIDEHASKHSAHSRLLSDLSQSHAHLKGRVEGVTSQLGQLDGEVDHLETRLRDDIKGKLARVRNSLYDALDKVGRSIEGIKEDVKKGMV